MSLQQAHQVQLPLQLPHLQLHVLIVLDNKAKPQPIFGTQIPTHVLKHHHLVLLIQSHPAFNKGIIQRPLIHSRPLQQVIILVLLH